MQKVNSLAEKRRKERCDNNPRPCPPAAAAVIMKLFLRIFLLQLFSHFFQLSARNNRLLRMFQVSKLSHLKILNLAGNSVVTMEGLKELKLLTWLSLASNNIKVPLIPTQNLNVI